MEIRSSKVFFSLNHRFAAITKKAFRRSLCLVQFTFFILWFFSPFFNFFLFIPCSRVSLDRVFVYFLFPFPCSSCFIDTNFFSPFCEYSLSPPSSLPCCRTFFSLSISNFSVMRTSVLLSPGVSRTVNPWLPCVFSFVREASAQLCPRIRPDSISSEGK